MHLRAARIVLLVLFASSVVAAQQKGKKDLLDNGVRIDLRQGTFYLLDNAPLQVQDVRANLRPAKNGVMELVIKSGQTFLASETLTQIMNQQMQGQKVKDLKFSTSGQKVKLQGTLQKAVPIPFTITGNIQTTPKGKIEIHTTSVDAAKLPVGGVMDLFGIQVKDVTGNIQQRAISLQGDTLVLSPDKLSKRLVLRGDVQRVEVQKDGLLLTFGGKQPMPQESKASAASGGKSQQQH
jgi:hypothetical protein